MPKITREQFDRLYDAEAHRLLGFFVARAPDVETARDLWAESLTEAFRCRGTFRGATDDERRSWLYGIAYRQLARYRRAGMIEARAMRKLGLRAPELSDSDVERLLDREEAESLRHGLDEALSGLPDGQANAVRGRVLDDQTYAELAADLEISQPAARARVSRALRTLEARLSAVRNPGPPSPNDRRTP